MCTFFAKKCRKDVIENEGARVIRNRSDCAAIGARGLRVLIAARRAILAMRARLARRRDNGYRKGSLLEALTIIRAMATIGLRALCVCLAMDDDVDVVRRLSFPFRRRPAPSRRGFVRESSICNTPRRMKRGVRNAAKTSFHPVNRRCSLRGTLGRVLA